ncbi:MAG TPA: hypothetical protein VFL82_01055 [Thermomicrobiales bacterium]|nr:hypothetical protein [Thermomicrobiales bacterium]
MARIFKRQPVTATDIARFAVGGIWITGAVVNAVWTIRQSAPYEWLAESPIPPYRWFFGIVGDHPSAWTAALIAGELTIGILTLIPGRWARLGLAGGILFSAALFASASPYTIIMGPYAVFLAWLIWKTRAPKQPKPSRVPHVPPVPL